LYDFFYCVVVLEALQRYVQIFLSEMQRVRGVGTVTIWIVLPALSPYDSLVDECSRIPVVAILLCNCQKAFQFLG
jgi:hypothetical protein